MTTERIDVLAVMLADATDAACERQWYEDAEELANRSQQARAAVAELIEADKAYDVAREAYEACIFVGACPHSRELGNAIERRAAALARMEPQS